MKNGAASTENSMEAPEKIKNYRRTQQFHFWVHTHKRVESRILKRYLYSRVHSSIIRNSQDLGEQKFLKHMLLSLGKQILHKEVGGGE